MRPISETWTFRVVMAIILVAALEMWSAAQHPDVVRVKASMGNGFAFVGSGALIGKTPAGNGVVLSCFHTFKNGAHEITVEFPTGRKHIAKLVAHDPVLDLTLLTIGQPPSDGTPVAERECAMGEPVVIAGFAGGPHGEPQYLEQRGQVVGWQSFAIERDTKAVIVSPAKGRQGDSGGPMFDAAGLVCGVIAVANDDPCYTSGTSGETLCQWVQGNCPGGRCWQQPGGRMVPVPKMKPRPTVPIPNGTPNTQPRPDQSTIAPKPDIDPSRPITPIGRSTDIQALKAAVEALEAKIAAAACKCDKPATKPAAPKPDTTAKGCQCGGHKNCECDPQKIAAAVTAAVKVEIDARIKAEAKARPRPPIIWKPAFPIAPSKPPETKPNSGPAYFEIVPRSKS